MATVLDSWGLESVLRLAAEPTKPWYKIIVLSFIRCVILCTILNMPDPNLPHVWIVYNNCTYLIWLLRLSNCAMFRAVPITYQSSLPSIIIIIWYCSTLELMFLPFLVYCLIHLAVINSSFCTDPNCICIHFLTTSLQPPC